MTGYQSKRAAAQDKLNDDDDTQVYQKPWVDLTRTQIQNIYFAILETHRGGHQMEGQLAFGEALQAAIKEKNNGTTPK
jgi:hypothetical protein